MQTRAHAGNGVVALKVPASPPGWTFLYPRGIACPLRLEKQESRKSMAAKYRAMCNGVAEARKPVPLGNWGVGEGILVGADQFEYGTD